MPTLMFVPQPGLGDRALGDGEQVLRRDLHVLALARRSGWAPASRRRRSRARAATRPGMRDPGAVVPGRDLAPLVRAHLARCAASLAAGIVLDGDLRRHAAHRVDAAAVAGLDQQLGVGLAGTRGPS